MGVHKLDVVKPGAEKGQHGRPAGGLGREQLGGDFCNQDLEILALFHWLYTIFGLSQIQFTRYQEGWILV